MATPRDYLEAAYAKSTKNTPGAIATEATELLNQVNRYIRGLFAAGTRMNLTYFGETSTVEKDAVGWARPDTAESVWLVTKTDATKVSIVPVDDQAVMGSRPALYRFGGIYREANGSLTDVTDLEFFFASRPADPADLDSDIDSRWPNQFDELPITMLAHYLALKDGRDEELAGLIAQIEHWYALYLAFLEHETVGEIRRFQPVRVNPSEAIVPITQILGLGGAS